MRGGTAWVVILATSACGRIAFDVGRADGGGSDGPTSSCATAVFSRPGASSLTDDFATGMLTDLWAPIAPCIQQTGGELVAMPSPTGSYCHAWTNATYHLSCDHITFRVAEATIQTNGAQTFVYLSQQGMTIDLLLEADFLFTGGSLPVGGYHMGGYDPVQDQWWRIEEADGTLSFSTSPDGVSWQPRGSTPDPMPLDDVQIAIGAGTWQAVASPGQARFHCYNLPPPCS